MDNFYRHSLNSSLKLANENIKGYGRSYDPLWRPVMEHEYALEYHQKALELLPKYIKNEISNVISQKRIEKIVNELVDKAVKRAVDEALNPKADHNECVPVTLSAEQMKWLEKTINKAVSNNMLIIESPY